MNDEKSLSAKEISSIIRACKSSGVKELQFQGLSIKFEPESEKATSPWIHYQAKTEHWPEETSAPISEEVEANEPSELDLEDLQITDPVAWETLRTQR